MDILLNLASGLVGAIVGAVVGAIATIAATNRQLRENARLAAESQAAERRRDASEREQAREEAKRQQRAVDDIARLRHEGVQLYARPLTAAGLHGWVDECNAWRSRVLQVLKEHFEYAVAEWFEDLGPFPTEGFVHAINDQHRHELNMLAHSLRTLTAIIERNTRYVQMENSDRV